MPGKVKMLEDEIWNRTDLDLDDKLDVHCGIAHTRWATHGKNLHIIFANIL